MPTLGCGSRHEALEPREDTGLEIDDRWEVAVIGRNLTNQRILQTASSMPLATTITRNAGNAYNGIVDRPRTIAVQLTGRF